MSVRSVCRIESNKNKIKSTEESFLQEKNWTSWNAASYSL